MRRLLLGFMLLAGCANQKTFPDMSTENMGDPDYLCYKYGGGLCTSTEQLEARDRQRAINDTHENRTKTEEAMGRSLARQRSEDVRRNVEPKPDGVYEPGSALSPADPLPEGCDDIRYTDYFIVQKFDDHHYEMVSGPQYGSRRAILE